MRVITTIDQSNLNISAQSAAEAEQRGFTGITTPARPLFDGVLVFQGCVT